MLSARNSSIDTRTPVILPDEHHESWLSGEAGKEVLVSPVPGRPDESMASQSEGKLAPE